MQSFLKNNEVYLKEILCVCKTLILSNETLLKTFPLEKIMRGSSYDKYVIMLN